MRKGLSVVLEYFKVNVLLECNMLEVIVDLVQITELLY